MLVLIPSAGVGSRLDYHTQHYNKAMIQIGDVPVISHIIETIQKIQNLLLCWI